LIIKGLSRLAHLANQANPANLVVMGIRNEQRESNRPHSPGWQSWQELAGDANHTKSSNDKHSGTTIGKLAHLDMKRKKANNEAYGESI
jgi:hypothetical protein